MGHIRDSVPRNSTESCLVSVLLWSSWAMYHACSKNLRKYCSYCIDCSPGFSVHWESRGKNTGVGCHFLLQGIFLPQGLNLGLLHCRQILYQLSHREAPEVGIH